MSSKPTVVVRNVSKVFHTQNRFTRFLQRVPSSAREVQALDAVSFVTYAGDSVGVLGRNGSGKSTLLRIIAGTENPNYGDVLVSSRPTLLGVSAALQAHLSGIDNVRLGLLASGLSPKEVRRLEQSVGEWADVGEAIYRPLNTYSSGMKARLKFAIATAVKREVLLVDEALSTGDAAFAAKAKERMEEFLDASGTVFLVSHGASTIQEHCNRAIWLHRGRIVADGDVDRVASAYQKWSKLNAGRKEDEAESFLRDLFQQYTPPQIILDLEAAKALNTISARE